MPPKRRFEETPDEPGYNAFDITPTDDPAVQFEFETRGVWVGVGGTLICEFVGGNVVTFQNVANGVLLPFRTVRVHATGTTASGIRGLY